MNWIQSKTNLLRTLPLDERYLIGVSGGCDSVALLHWLLSVGYKGLIVCHLNHRLRGRSSQTDARFVKGLARQYRLNFQVGAVDVRALAKRKKISMETAARDARYSFFAKSAVRHQCGTIFLGHQADDLVETFLINLFRGSGTAGLAGMREMSTRRVDGIDLEIARPLLGIWRKEIGNYVHEHGLKFREDASNRDLSPLRNRIRHRLIPYLEKTLGRNVRPAIWRTAAITGEEETWIEQQLPVSGEAELSATKLRALPVALQRRAVLKWLRGQNVAQAGFDVVERVRSIANPGARVSKVNLANNRHARRRAGRIFLE